MLCWGGGGEIVSPGDTPCIIENDNVFIVTILGFGFARGLAPNGKSHRPQTSTNGLFDVTTLTDVGLSDALLAYIAFYRQTEVLYVFDPVSCLRLLNKFIPFWTFFGVR